MPIPYPGRLRLFFGAAATAEFSVHRTRLRSLSGRFVAPSRTRQTGIGSSLSCRRERAELLFSAAALMPSAGIVLSIDSHTPSLALELPFTWRCGLVHAHMSVAPHKEAIM